MLQKIKNLFKNDFIKGGFFYTGSAFFISFLNYIFNFLTARTLGPQGYGEITALFSYLTIITIPTFVISSYVIQKIASSGDNKFEYAAKLEQLFWTKIKKYWPIIALTFLFVPLIPQITNLSPTSSLFLLPLILLTFVGSIYGAIQQGLNILVVFSSISISASFIKLSGPLLVIMGIDGYLTIILMLTLSTLLPLWFSIVLLRKSFKKMGLIQLSKIEAKVRSLFFNRQFILILVSTLALNLLNNLDIIFVKKYLTSQEAGIYSSWSLLAKIILYVVGPFISLSFIFFSGEKKKNQNVFRISLIALLIIGICSYIGYTYFSRMVVGIFFGNRFMTVLPYLSRAAIFGSLYAAVAFINNYYVAKKSSISLIAPIFVPIYFILLFLIKKNLDSIMQLNIFFTLTVTILYLGFYLKEELHLNSKST